MEVHRVVWRRNISICNILFSFQKTTSSSASPDSPFFLGKKKSNILLLIVRVFSFLGMQLISLPALD